MSKSTTTNFYLKDKKAKSPTPIFLYFRFKGKQLKYYVGEKVLPKNWNSNAHRVKKNSTDDYSSLNEYLYEVETTINTIYRKVKKNKPSIALLKDLLNTELEGTNSGDIGLMDRLDTYITNKKVEENTKKKFRALKGHLLGFMERNNVVLSYDDIDYQFYERFSSYLYDDLNHMDNTVNKYFSAMKSFLRWSKNMGFFPSFEVRKLNEFKQDFDIKERNGDFVYLSFEEVDRVYKLDLSKRKFSHLDKYRDLFCLECYTSLRFSDVTSIKPHHIKKNKIQMVSQKTGDKLTLPLFPETETILNKYKGEYNFLPNISNPKFNKHIKKICELAGIDEEVELVKHKRGRAIPTVGKKYEFVTSHTGRRTFVTSHLLAGVPAKVIREITNHKDAKSFERYIKVTEEIAVDLITKAHLNRLSS